MEYDVKPVVTANGTYSVILESASTDSTYFYSRQNTNTALGPRLVVTYSTP